MIIEYGKISTEFPREFLGSIPSAPDWLEYLWKQAKYGACIEYGAEVLIGPPELVIREDDWRDMALLVFPMMRILAIDPAEVVVYDPSS